MSPLGIQGPEVFSAAALAQELGVSKATVFHHFSSLDSVPHGSVPHGAFELLFEDFVEWQAACASRLVGEGTGLAMTEAYVLAGELALSSGDVPLAFQRYHEMLSPFVADQQDHAKTYRMSFVAANQPSVWTRDLLIKMTGLPGLTKVMARRAQPSFSFDDYTSGS